MIIVLNQPLIPVAGAGDAAGVAVGAPLLPAKFVWRRQEFVVTEVLEQWKESGPCRHGSGEQYIRKRWFRVQTGGGEWKIYFERQARSKREIKSRWWLYTVMDPSPACPE